MGKTSALAPNVGVGSRPTKKRTTSVHVRCSPGLIRELREFDDFGSPAEVLKRAFAEAKTMKTPLFQE